MFGVLFYFAVLCAFCKNVAKLFDMLDGKHRKK